MQIHARLTHRVSLLVRPLLRAVFSLSLGAMACSSARDPQESTVSPVPAVSPLLVALEAVPEKPQPPPSREQRIVARAREEVRWHVRYDSSYVPLTFRDGTDTHKPVYPGGDLDSSRGVCTDVVVRALRAVGLDLQQRVHEDILRRPQAYALQEAPNANIDHRRVRPILTYLRAHASSLPKGFDGSDRESWQPGDVVVWAFHPCPRCSPDHIGVVSDRLGARRLPLVIHNIGPEPTEDDVVDSWTVLGHFRPAD